MPGFDYSQVDQFAVVSSLPGNPANGTEVLYRTGAGDDDVFWHLRYDSSVTDAYKWRYIGGPPIVAETIIDPAGAGTALPVEASVVTVQSITVPRAGKYDLHYDCWIRMHTGTTDAHAYIYLGSTKQTASHNSKGIDNAWQPMALNWRNTWSAGDVLNLKFYTDVAAANAKYWGSYLSLTPVRVS